MSLLIAIETFIIFPVLFVEKFIAPSAYFAPASSSSVASTALHERPSFKLRLPLHNYLDVFAKEVQGLLSVLGV